MDSMLGILNATLNFEMPNLELPSSELRAAVLRTSYCRTANFVLRTSNLVLRTSYCPTSEFAFFRIPDPSTSGGALEEDRGTLQAGRGSEGLGRQGPWGPGAQKHRKMPFKSPISGAPPLGGGGHRYEGEGEGEEEAVI